MRAMSDAHIDRLQRFARYCTADRPWLRQEIEREVERRDAPLDSSDVLNDIITCLLTSAGSPQTRPVDVDDYDDPAEEIRHVFLRKLTNTIIDELMPGDAPEIRAAVLAFMKGLGLRDAQILHLYYMLGLTWLDVDRVLNSRLRNSNDDDKSNAGPKSFNEAAPRKKATRRLNELIEYVARNKRGLWTDGSSRLVKNILVQARRESRKIPDINGLERRLRDTRPALFSRPPEEWEALDDHPEYAEYEDSAEKKDFEEVFISFNETYHDAKLELEAPCTCPVSHGKLCAAIRHLLLEWAPAVPTTRNKAARIFHLVLMGYLPQMIQGAVRLDDLSPFEPRSEAMKEEFFQWLRRLEPEAPPLDIGMVWHGLHTQR